MFTTTITLRRNNNELIHQFNLKHEDVKEALIQFDMGAVLISAVVLMFEGYMEKERTVQLPETYILPP